MKRAAVALCFLAIPLACAESEPPITQTSEPLIAGPEEYTGLDLGPKELVLTFDDGPGPAGVTGALSTYLKTRPKPIHATFFVNGACIAATTLSPNDSCGEPVVGANAVLAQLVADGHLVANHTTTHRDLVSLQSNLIVRELEETDALIQGYMPYGRFFFRAPYGSWSTRVYNSLKDTAMNKYVGPVYWSIDAQDWDCWPSGLTTKQCGDRYLAEIRAVGRGIVLLHDPYSSATGNTVDMVKYIVPILEADGFTFKALEDVPSLRAVLPTCHASCSACSGPTANDCTACKAGTTLASGACVTDARDAGTTAPPSSNPPVSQREEESATTSPAEAEEEEAEEEPASGCASAASPRGGGAAIAQIALAVAAVVRRRRRSLPRHAAATN
jgi:peptidoglycan/xylan/chitin deacetylase (PgdA/CDA1 family)